MSEYAEMNRFVVAADRLKVTQPHETTLRHLGSTLIRGVDAVIDLGVNISNIVNKFLKSLWLWLHYR